MCWLHTSENYGRKEAASEDDIKEMAGKIGTDSARM
jgi:hypothetical protein